MHTRAVRKYLATRKHTPTPEQQHKAEFDDLVRQASRGNHHAIASITAAFGPVLLGVARLCPGPRYLQAEEAVEDFLASFTFREREPGREDWDEP
jgi:hypothetical protein